MQIELTRSSIDHLLYLVAKDYKKNNRGASNIEIILAGGASILLNYNFRESTTDLDAIIRASSSIKDSINRVGDNNQLPPGWLNADFIKTASYSPKLAQYSQFYKVFCNCLTARTISGKYLLAMKLRSAREYKHDLSDIIGIIKEMEETESKISYQEIMDAYTELYGDDIDIRNDALIFLKNALTNSNLEDLYYTTVQQEAVNKAALKLAEETYHSVVNDDNASDFIRHFVGALNPDVVQPDR